MSCGCINFDCSHRVAVTTSSSTTTTLCPDAITNDSVYPGECVVYTGEDSACFTLSSGDNIFGVLYNLLLLFDPSCTTTTTTTTIPITTTSTTTTTTRPPRTTTTTSTTLRPTTTTTTSTTSTSTTSTTTVDPSLVNTTVYLVCCKGYPFVNIVPAIVLPYTLPTNITIAPNNIYYETDGLTINTTWVAGLLSDIQGLGYPGATVTYQPNFNNFTLVVNNTITGVPFINAIATCATVRNQSGFLPLLCPVVNPNFGTSTTTINPDFTTSTSTTSTTTLAPITSTTSTTTTSVPMFLRTCAPLYNDDNGNIYSYEVGTNTSQFVFASGYSYLDIAHTETKLWLPTPTYIVEYDITLSPFTITPGKTIPLPLGYVQSLGLASKTDDTIISVNEKTNPGAVSEINTLTGVITPQFNLVSGRKVSGDFMLTSTGKFIVTSQITFGGTFPQTFYFISQYDYATGTLEVDIDITATINKAWGIFEDAGEIFIMSNDGGVYTIGKDFPYTITFVSNTGNTLRGASQPVSCLTEEFLITSTTTSTTTTLIPTTTTTSTTTSTTTTSSTSTTTTTDFPPSPARCVNTNVGFNTDLSGWEVSKYPPFDEMPTNDWIWDNGRAAYNGGTTGGYIAQFALTVGFTYRITLDLEIINSGFLFNKSIIVYAGTTASSIINTIGLTSVDVTLTCTDNEYLTIYGIDSIDGAGTPYYMFIDNVCAEQTIPPPTTTTSTTTTSTTTTLEPTTTTTTLEPTTTTSTTTSTTTLEPTTTTTTSTTTSTTTTTTTLEPTTTTTTILLDCVILGILGDTTTTTSTTSTTTTITPLDFTLTSICDPTVELIGENPIGGVPGYEFGTSYFATEIDALACSSWAVSIAYYYGAVDGTWWVVVRDSVGTLKAKSITTSCPTTTTTVEPTTTTTTSTSTTTSTTSTTTTQFNFAKCADCVPTLAGITQGTQGLLNVGLLSSSLCTLGDFVIDWYLNSTSAPSQTFSSKNSGNTDITASQVHPFSIPSQSGTWIPVIKYITLDGVAYGPDGGAYSLSSDLATCLPTVSITSLTCPAPTVGQPFYNNQGAGYAQYSHWFKYTATNTSVAGDANKTMSMELNSDGSTKYLPWWFYAFNISDTIKFSYISPLLGTTTLLEEYVIGGNVTTDLTASPKRWGTTGFKGVLNLTSFTYNTGDRILIEVIGNYVNPSNPGTDWWILLKCLNTFSTAYTKTAAPTPCSTTFAISACNNQLYATIPGYNDNTTTDLYKYLLWSGSTGISGTLNQAPTNAIPILGIPLSLASTNCVTGTGAPYNSPNPFSPVAHPFTVTKTGAHVVLDFTNDVEYDYYRNAYNTAYAENALTYSSDITNINHFKFIWFFIYSGASFESYNNRSILFHQTSSVVFVNDGVTRTITIDMVNAGASSVPFTPGCVNGCNLLPDWTNTDRSIKYVYYGATSGTANYVTENGAGIYTYSVRARYVVGPNPVLAATVSTDNGRYADMYLAYIGSPTCVFTTTPTDWYAYTGASRRYIDLKFVLKLTITNSADPLNNFKFENQINPVTGYYASNVGVSTIYEKVAGVITTPSAGCP